MHVKSQVLEVLEYGGDLIVGSDFHILRPIRRSVKGPVLQVLGRGCSLQISSVVGKKVCLRAISFFPRKGFERIG
ncbi:unnamed protein product, partial [Ilex paraguariensis]